MQGKDVPTSFKRRRDDKPAGPAAYQFPGFAPMYPGFFMFDGHNIYSQAAGLPAFPPMPGSFPSAYPLQTAQTASITGGGSVTSVDLAGNGAGTRLALPPPRASSASGGRRTRRRKSHDHDDDAGDGDDESTEDEGDPSEVENQLRVGQDEGEVFSQMTAALRSRQRLTPRRTSRATSEVPPRSSPLPIEHRVNPGPSEPQAPVTISQDKGKGRADPLPVGLSGAGRPPGPPANAAASAGPTAGVASSAGSPAPTRFSEGAAPVGQAGGGPSTPRHGSTARPSANAGGPSTNATHAATSSGYNPGIGAFPGAFPGAPGGASVREC